LARPGIAGAAAQITGGTNRCLRLTRVLSLQEDAVDFTPCHAISRPTTSGRAQHFASNTPRPLTLGGFGGQSLPKLEQALQILRTPFRALKSAGEIVQM
jgi:hypothetical protein